MPAQQMAAWETSSACQQPGQKACTTAARPAVCSMVQRSAHPTRHAEAPKRQQQSAALTAAALAAVLQHCGARCITGAGTALHPRNQ